jgi:hypothetical protein
VDDRRRPDSGKEDRGHRRAHLAQRYLARLCVPCGISDRGVTSVEAEIDERIYQTPTLEQMANSVARHFARVFAQPVLWVDSLEELAGTEGR